MSVLFMSGSRSITSDLLVFQHASLIENYVPRHAPPLLCTWVAYRLISGTAPVQRKNALGATVRDTSIGWGVTKYNTQFVVNDDGVANYRGSAQG